MLLVSLACVHKEEGQPNLQDPPLQVQNPCLCNKHTFNATVTPVLRRAFADPECNFVEWSICACARVKGATILNSPVPPPPVAAKRVRPCSAPRPLRPLEDAGTTEFEKRGYARLDVGRGTWDVGRETTHSASNCSLRTVPFTICAALCAVRALGAAQPHMQCRPGYNLSTSDFPLLICVCLGRVAFWCIHRRTWLSIHKRERARSHMHSHSHVLFFFSLQV